MLLPGSPPSDALQGSEAAPTSSSLTASRKRKNTGPATASSKLWCRSTEQFTASEQLAAPHIQGALPHIVDLTADTPEPLRVPPKGEHPVGLIAAYLQRRRDLVMREADEMTDEAVANVNPANNTLRPKAVA
jgi:hypothetical protein